MASKAPLGVAGARVLQAVAYNIMASLLSPTDSVKALKDDITENTSQ